MTYATHDIEADKRKAADKAALAIARHRNRQSAHASERRFYIVATCILIAAAILILVASKAKAEENAALRQDIARLHRAADEVDARLAAYAYLRDCKARHELTQALRLGGWLGASVRERGQRINIASHHSSSFLLGGGAPDAPLSRCRPLIPSQSQCVGTLCLGAAGKCASCHEPAAFDFQLRDFLTEYISGVNKKLSFEDAEMLATACVELGGGNEDDALRWAATCLAENSGRLHSKPNSIGCYGAFQINEPVHSSKLAAMGLDIHSSFADQVTFARHLHEKRGWQPWIASISNTKKYLRGLRKEWEEVDVK